MAAGAALACISLGTTAGAASANLLPGPAPALMWAKAATGAGPPNYPESDPGYGIAPAADPDGIGPWLPVGASAAAAIGLAGGVLWYHRRRTAAA